MNILPCYTLFVNSQIAQLISNFAIVSSLFYCFHIAQTYSIGGVR